MRKTISCVVLAAGLVLSVEPVASASEPPRPDPIASSPTHVADQCVSLFNWAWDIDTQYENYLGWQNATIDGLRAENASQAREIRRLRAQVRRLSHRH
jgi:hypothetical protein